MKRLFFARGAAALGVAAVLLTTAGVTTYAQAASAGTATAASHPGVSHLTVFPVTASRRAANNPCAYPNHDFCVFQDAGCTTNGYVVPTADHSAWINFGAVGVPYHPQCIVNASNSSVWVEDESTEFPACAPPDHTVSASDEQFGWFFVKYNVSTCGSEPSGE